MKRQTKKLIYNTLACLLLAAALIWVCQKFIHLGTIEYTENAQVRQHIIPLNARVQGFVKAIYFDEYSSVKQGDTLLLIEDAEYRFQVAQAEANLENARKGKDAMHKVLTTTDHNLSISDAVIEEARIHLENAERNYQRYAALYEQQAVTRKQHDDMQTAYQTAKVRYERLCRERARVEAVQSEQNSRLGQNEAGIKVAEAALKLARLNLSYTVITAPCDGVTGRKELQIGQLIQPGQTIVDLVKSDEKWVIANYKETQTAHISEGQMVDLTVDAVPGYTFKGVVRSISQATGASFSLIPQDHSSGNFVKIEQRIPIRIDFTQENDPKSLERVCAGMNVRCKVHY